MFEMNSISRTDGSNNHAQRFKEVQLVFWQRLIVTVIAMVVSSILAGFVWHAIFGGGLPGYISGVVGGLTALPVWEFLKRVKPKSDR